jgi:serine/threonine-protein kinase
VTYDVRSDPGDLAPGDQVAGYQIQERIGRGGMAVVYRALDLRLGRTVALKVLAPDLGADEAFRLRFMRESRAAAGVDHPHIVPVFEAGEAGGVLFIAMRYVGGGDVRSLIETEGRLSPGRAAAIASHVASALDAAHARGLVHRDVKPGNILLGQASNGLDHAYLADFGLSKLALTSSTLTSTGQFLGTLDYVSPEQIQGQPVDGRADQYALACTVVEMLTGAPPFRRHDTRALMWAQLEAEPPRLTERRPELPPVADQVIGRALAKTADGRYPTCRDFAAALTAACAPMPGRAELSRGPAEPADGLWPALSPSQWPGDSQPTVTAIAQDGAGFGAGFADGRGGAAGAAGGPGERVRGLVRQPEPELARNFLTPGTPDAPRWPDQPPARAAASPVRRRRGRRSGVAVTVAICVAVFVLGVAGAVAYRLAHRHNLSTPPPAATKTVTVPPPASATDPRAIVREYFADINSKNYPAAWQLVPQIGGYQQFRDGFIGTARDNFKIVSVTGSVVRVNLEAVHDDGTVRYFTGTYTVTNGKISSADMRRVA